MGNVLRNNNAFTLIEFLVAIVILMVGLLGLLQTVNVSLHQSMQNQMRNEGVGVADAEMAKELAKGYDGADTSFKNYTVGRRVLNAYAIYSVSRSGTSLQNSKQVNIDVSWRYKKQRFTQSASSVLSKANQ